MMRLPIRSILILLASCGVGCRDPEPAPPERPRVEPAPAAFQPAEPAIDLSDAPPWRTTLSTSGASVCHVRDGAVECWGEGYSARPRRIANIDDALEVMQLRDRGCVFRESERLSCWYRSDIGLRDMDESGPLVTELRHHPLPGAVNWEGFGGSGCAIYRDRTAQCFTLCITSSPRSCYRGAVPVGPLFQSAVHAMKLREASCALKTDGSVECAGSWRRSITGQQGAELGRVPGLSGTMAFIAYYETCVGGFGSRLTCMGPWMRPWDVNGVYSPGLWDGSPRFEQLSASFSRPVFAVPTDYASYLIHERGEVTYRHHWQGSMPMGQLPGPVHMIVDVQERSMCVELHDGRVLCRGAGDRGQLGDGRYGEGVETDHWQPIAPTEER